MASQTQRLEAVYNCLALVRGTVVQARFYLTAALLISGVSGRYALGQDQSTSQGKKEPTALFSPVPENIWNRLYRQLHVRSTYDGKEYGFADLDPLLWDETKYLRNGDSNKKALDLLDEFLSTRAEQRIRDPIKRAVLQRDLFAVFDWASSSNLAERLGQVIWRLALSPTEVDALPDTYTIAVSRKEFPAAYDATQPNRAFLPADLFDINGPWVCVGASDWRLAAPGHDAGFDGGSVFLVFARLPGGRQATLAYLEQLANLHIPPQFPENTEFALVRKLALPTVYGNLMLTPITESVQIRHYSGVRLAADDSEIKLDRAMVFEGNHSGLREVTPEDKEFPVFMTHGFDPFEDNRWAAGLPVASLATCNGCHGHAGYSGIASVMSFSFRGSQNPRLAETTPSNEAEKVIRGKQMGPSWKSLIKLANSGLTSR